MATGKTNKRFIVSIFDGIDLSGDTRDIGQCGYHYEENERTGLGEAVENFSLGQPSLQWGPYNAIFNNTATFGSHIALDNLEDPIVSHLIGIRAAPAIGDPCISTPIGMASYMTNGEGAVSVSVTTSGPTAAWTAPTSIFGTLMERQTLLALTASETINSTSVDQLASSTGGGYGYFHVETNSGGAVIAKIQDSANDSTWADLITFTIDGTSRDGEQGVVTGSVDRYVRFSITNTTGGSINIGFTATFVRGK